MEPDVYKVLLWLYQKNPWIYISYILQREIIFGGGGINSNFGGQIHQIQFIKGPVHYIFANLFLGMKKSPCENRKNVFYFTSKPLFVFKKIKF